MAAGGSAWGALRAAWGCVGWSWGRGPCGWGKGVEGRWRGRLYQPSSLGIAGPFPGPWRPVLGGRGVPGDGAWHWDVRAPDTVSTPPIGSARALSSGASHPAPSPWVELGSTQCVLPCCVVSCRVVSCRVVSCRVVSCRVVSCRVVSCRVVSCRVVSCRVVLCCVVLCCVVLCCVVLCCVVLCCVVLCCVVTCRVVYCRVVLYCVVLCCVVLCCAVLCCVVLCCVVLCCVVLCSVVLCCVVLCCVVLCCVVLCCVVLCCVVLCCVVLCCVVLCCVVLCCVVLCCVVLCCVVLCCVLLCCVVLCCVVLCCVVLCCVVLCCVVLCCVVLCCVVLCCIVCPASCADAQGPASCAPCTARPQLMAKPQCRANGACGCQDNINGRWAGEFCDRCADSFWGANCDRGCICTAGQSTCDQFTGNCVCFADSERGFFAGEVVPCALCRSDPVLVPDPNVEFFSVESGGGPGKACSAVRGTRGPGVWQRLQRHPATLGAVVSRGAPSEHPRQSTDLGGLG